MKEDKKRARGRVFKYDGPTKRKIFLFPAPLETQIKEYIEIVSKPYLSEEYKSKKK